MEERFHPTLTKRVRDLIAERGRASLAPTDPRFQGVCPTPEMTAVLNRVAPIAEALFLVMAADGLCTFEERVALRGALRTITDDELSKPAISALIDRFDQSLEHDGLRARVSRVAAELASDRIDSQVMLELAAAMIRSDGEVTHDERRILAQLAEETGHDPEMALALIA